MEVLLKKRPKKYLLDYLAQSSQKVSEEISRVERLYEELLRKGESNAFLKALVEKIASELTIPDPPLPPESEALPQRLEEYERGLRSLEEALKQTLSFLERVEKVLPEADKAVERVENYVKLVSPLNPTMASEAAKAAARVRRVQELLLKEPKMSTLADLERGLEELDRVERALRAEYEKALGFILRDLQATREVARRAVAAAVLQEKSVLEREVEKLNRLEQELVELKVNPQPLDTQKFYAELRRIKSAAEEVLNKNLAPSEAKVLESVLWLASSSDSKVFEFSDFVELVARRGEVGTSEALSALYRLSKNGAVKVVVRVLA
ncbi:hypothetical protein [Infirmifilum sp. SLHALR2]|nr:MAG: hypothetical protein B7L53_02245 [Thermofilum sp. NZ13]